MIFKYGELFCGPGGLAYGATSSEINTGSSQFKIIHKWANDSDEDSCKTYRLNICPDDPESVKHKDVRKLELNRLPPIDALAFGFPCNDFSVVGERKGINGDFGPLYSYGVQALEIFKPKWFLAENVGGLKSSNNGEAFKEIIKDLAKTGYKLTVHLYKFEEYGIPQTRHRIIIVGIDENADLIFKVPEPTYVSKSCRDALENPPIPPDAPNQEYTKQSKTVIERLENIKPGENAWTADLPKHLQLNVKRAKLSHIYRRLDPEKPAYTVTGSGGGGTHTYHWKDARALTNRERARLQTFPDTFEFKGSKESVRKQIGMAVPVEGAKSIIEAILKTFAEIKYPFIEPNIGYYNPFHK